jgi:5'-nucleotidase
MEFPNSFLDKYQWLERHFSFIPWRNYVFCGDKSILNADYLIDDNAYNFDGFRGEGLLFDAPHNALETRYRRVHGWQEIGELLL